MPKAKKIIKEKFSELLKLMEVEDFQVEIEEQEDNFKVNIDCQEKGLLIGNFGETISSLQLVLSIMIYKQLGKWRTIIVDVGDYREQRKERLEKMALNAAQKAKFTKEKIEMPFLNSAERRIIHLALQEDTEVETESQGEGRERRLIIKPVQEEAEEKE